MKHHLYAKEISNNLSTVFITQVNADYTKSTFFFCFDKTSVAGILYLVLCLSTSLTYIVQNV